MLGTHYAKVYDRGEQSIGRQEEDNKKRGGIGQGAATNAWGGHVTGSKSQRGGNLGNGGKGKAFYIQY